MGGRDLTGREQFVKLWISHKKKERSKRGTKG